MVSVDVSVVIVSYNARELLGRCLAAVYGAGGAGVSLETIVVDNESTDGSADWVREHFPQVRVIDAGRNGGMGFGNNVGMLAASGRTMLLLNSDAFLEPGSLRAMLARLDSRPDVGLVGPRLRNEDRSLQRSVRGFPSLWRLATEFFYLRKFAPRSSRVFNGFYGAGFAHDTDAEVEWVMGAVMLVRREAIDDVGLMNEAYFMYDEEVDWQRRMHDAGWKVLFTPVAEVIHLGGGSSRKNWGRMYQVQICSHVRYMALMHGARAGARAKLLMSVALLLRATIYRILGALPGGEARRRRSDGFVAARQALSELDLDAVAAERVIPAWAVRNNTAGSNR